MSGGDAVILVEAPDAEVVDGDDAGDGLKFVEDGSGRDVGRCAA